MPKLKNNTTQEQEVVEEKVAPGTQGGVSSGIRLREEEEAKELIQLVVFELDEEEYAVKISEIREILRMPEVTPMPNTPDFIEGVINVRGKIVVVIDLEERFNLGRTAEKKSLHVVLTEIGENTFGAIVDEVTEVLRVPKDSIEAAPSIIAEKIQADYVSGIVVLEGRLLILLDFNKVFEEKGLAELGNLVKKQAKITKARQAEEKPKQEETEAERKAKVESMLKERLQKRETPKQSSTGDATEQEKEPSVAEQHEAEKSKQVEAKTQEAAVEQALVIEKHKNIKT